MFVICTIWVFAWAAVFVGLEDWGYFDSVWYACVTLSTIGFGDFVPITISGRLAAFLFIAIGIGMVAAFIAGLTNWFELIRFWLLQSLFERGAVGEKIMVAQGIKVSLQTKDEPSGQIELEPSESTSPEELTLIHTEAEEADGMSDRQLNDTQASNSDPPSAPVEVPAQDTAVKDKNLRSALKKKKHNGSGSSGHSHLAGLAPLAPIAPSRHGNAEGLSSLATPYSTLQPLQVSAELGQQLRQGSGGPAANTKGGGGGSGGGGARRSLFSPPYLTSPSAQGVGVGANAVPDPLSPSSALEAGNGRANGSVSPTLSGSARRDMRTLPEGNAANAQVAPLMLNVRYEITIYPDEKKKLISFHAILWSCNRQSIFMREIKCKKKSRKKEK